MAIHGNDIMTMTDEELTNLRLRRIGFIFQTFNLIPVLSVWENVEFPLLLMKKKAKLTKAEIEDETTNCVEA